MTDPASLASWGRTMLAAMEEKTPEWKVALRQALKENAWFTESSISLALRTICHRFLNEDRLKIWLRAYPDLPVRDPRRVGIIMAGNIPMVGFHDLLCVVASGNTAVIKPSSKDRALLDFSIRCLRRITPSVDVTVVEKLDAGVEAIIATGSDNTNRYFQTVFNGIPRLLRRNRYSIAVLTGRETEVERTGLAADILTHCGLGCRNVSKLLVPVGFDLSALAVFLSSKPSENRKFQHAARHRKALLSVQALPFLEAGEILLREIPEPSDSIAEVTVTRYENLAQVKQWLRDQDTDIQCVAGMAEEHPRGVCFGETQTPALEDYADGRDTMSFLAGL